MKTSHLLAVGIALIGCNAMADQTCDRFATAIDAELKKYSADVAFESIGVSNPQQDAVRQTRMATSIALINANINLMALNKCQVPSDPIGTPYLSEAIRCIMANRASAPSSGQRTPECDRKTWKKAATPQKEASE